MKLIMTLLVRDEEDVLRENIEYHLSQGVDFIIATDNRSVDSTPEILREYELQGVLISRYEADDDYSQHAWVTQMARRARIEYGADWVINNDADEFWWPEEGATLKEVLSKLPPEAEAATASRTNFVPRLETEAVHFLRTMTIRETDSRNALGLWLPPKVCHRGHPEVTVAQGNHEVWFSGTKILPETAPISILHFPIRTYERYRNKIANGGAAYQRNTDLPEYQGHTWRTLHRTFRLGGFRSWYESQIPATEDVSKAIEEGRLIQDDRLRHYFAERLNWRFQGRNGGS